MTANRSDSQPVTIDGTPEPALVPHDWPAEVKHLTGQAAADRELILKLRDEHSVDRATIDNVEIALVSARRIGIAVGILMATHKITAEAGFDRLSKASQDANVKLRFLAEYIIDTGELPAQPTKRR